MALPWLIKGGIDSALHQGAAQVFPLKYPLLILGAAALQGFFRYCGIEFSPICKSFRSVIFSTPRPVI